MSDDLDSFFQEIDQVVVATSTTNDSSYNIDENNTDAIPVISKVISKPAEILGTSKELQSVYNYTQSLLKDTNNNNDKVTTSSATNFNTNNSFKFSSFSTTTHQIAPTLSSSLFNNKSAVETEKEKKFVRKAADEVWVDDSLKDWPDNDYRIFVGDLAKEVSTEMMAKQFQHYKSFAKAKVIRTKYENKARGFGFVSFLDPMDCAKAIREMQGKYLGTRPMKITKSSWKDRDIQEVQKKEKKKRKMEESLGLV